MAMKDLLGRFQKQDSEEFELDDILNDIPEAYTEPEAEKPSFVFTDIHSEPIKPTATKISSSDDNRFQMFEIDLSGKKARATSTHSDTIPIPKIPNMEDATRVTSVPKASETDDDYEVDFGYSAPGALDDITFTTNPASVSKPVEPEPVVYNRTTTPDIDDEEYYDSYEPMFEESYGPGSYFASDESAPASAEPVFEETAEPVKVYNTPKEPKTYSDDKPRYENYRKDYKKAAADHEPRTYENNIDDSVFLPDEGDTPLNSRRNRRRLTVAIIAIIVAILLVLGAFLISHFSGRSNDDAEVAVTTGETTAFERSVSNNASATTTTTEEVSAIIDDEDDLDDTTTRTTESTSTSRRTSTTTSTTTSSRTTTSRSTTSRTTRSTTSTTRSTTTTTAAPTTAAPTTAPTTRSTTAAPSPWDQINR